MNSMLLGVLSGVENQHGANGLYWSLIVPHGVIELSSTSRRRSRRDPAPSGATAAGRAADPRRDHGAGVREPARVRPRRRVPPYRLEGDRPSRPVVALHQPERGQTLVLVLEAGRLMQGAGGAGLGKIDRSVNAAVMLAAVAREFGDAVGLVAFSHRPLATLAPSSRPGRLRRVVDVVARLEPDLVEPDRRMCLAALMRMSRRRAVVVFFSDALYAQFDRRRWPGSAAGA